jgi:hypothetical protein
MPPSGLRDTGAGQLRLHCTQPRYKHTCFCDETVDLRLVGLHGSQIHPGRWHTRLLRVHAGWRRQCPAIGLVLVVPHHETFCNA